MSESGSVYWIYLDEHTDPFTQGYVGITNDPKRRFREHKLKYTNNIKIMILDSGTTDYCKEKEKEFRPISNIGWNIAPGGSKPPPSYGRSWNKGLTKYTDERIARQSKTVTGRTKETHNSVARMAETKRGVPSPKKGIKTGFIPKFAFQKGHVPWNKNI